MGLSITQRFLVAANQIAAPDGCFHWRSVGQAIGISESQSDATTRALDDRRLLIRLVGGEARLLAAGRQRAAELQRGRS